MQLDRLSNLRKNLGSLSRLSKRDWSSAYCNAVHPVRHRRCHGINTCNANSAPLNRLSRFCLCDLHKNSNILYRAIVCELNCYDSRCLITRPCVVFSGMFKLWLHRIQVSCRLRPFFHIRPYTDLAAEYEAEFMQTLQASNAYFSADTVQ